MKILLHGSYFGLNFGDTLLCRLFSDWIKGARPGCEVLLPLANRRNQELIGSDGRGLMAIPGADALMLCGGGYFGEPSKAVAAWTRRAYRRHIIMAKYLAAGKPLSILGVGVGPVSSPRLRRDMVDLFERAQTVVVRDEASADYLRRWGLQRHLEVATDAVVTASEDELRSGLVSAPASLVELRERYGHVICIHNSGEPLPAELDFTRELVAWLLKETGFGLVLASDSVPRRRPTTWVDRFEVGSNEGRVLRFRYDGDPRSMIGLLSEVDLSITTKLHVGIVSSALHVPVISLPRHNKTPRFYRQMELDDWCIDFPMHERLKKLVLLLREWEDGRRPDYSTFEIMRRRGYYKDAIRAALPI